MTVGQRKWTPLAIVSILWVASWWWLNPIHLHQRVKMGSVTLLVPFGWVVQITPSQVDPVAYVGLRRVRLPWTPSHSWATGMISIGRPMGGRYTLESGRLAQSKSAADYGDRAYYSDSRTFDLSSEKHLALCAEGTMLSNGKTLHSQVSTCYVVGTPLLATFTSAHDVDRDAETILKSLD